MTWMSNWCPFNFCRDVTLIRKSYISSGTAVHRQDSLTHGSYAGVDFLSEDVLVPTAFTNIICISIHFPDNDVVHTSNLHHDHLTQHTLPLWPGDDFATPSWVIRAVETIGAPWSWPRRNWCRRGPRSSKTIEKTCFQDDLEKFLWYAYSRLLA